MHADLREAIIASVRRRFEQGDCPTEPAHTVETLEHVILDLSSKPPAGGDAVPAGEETQDQVVELLTAEFGCTVGHSLHVHDKLRLIFSDVTVQPPDANPYVTRWRKKGWLPPVIPKPHDDADTIPAGEVEAFRRGAEAMQHALADALRDHLNSRAAAIANGVEIPEYRR